MRQPLKIILAVVLAAGIAGGCGSDDESSSGDSGGSEKTDKSAKAADDRKTTSARGRMVKCMERAGFEVTHKGQDAAAATNYAVESDSGSKKAKIVIHSSRDDARRSSVKAAGEGTNAVAFGRAEFIPQEATNTQAGVIANCVAQSYVR